MSRLKPIAMVLLFILGMTATMHCALERAGMFDTAPACCADEKDQTDEAGQCESRCAMLDGGMHKLSIKPVKAPVLTLLANFEWAAEPTCVPAPAGVISPATTDFPPELARTWQFVTRTALPARAPSLAS